MAGCGKLGGSGQLSATPHKAGDPASALKARRARGGRGRVSRSRADRKRREGRQNAQHDRPPKDRRPEPQRNPSGQRHRPVCRGQSGLGGQGRGTSRMYVDRHRRRRAAQDGRGHLGSSPRAGGLADRRRGGDGLSRRAAGGAEL